MHKNKKTPSWLELLVKICQSIFPLPERELLFKEKWQVIRSYQKKKEKRKKGNFCFTFHFPLGSTRELHAWDAQLCVFCVDRNSKCCQDMPVPISIRTETLWGAAGMKSHINTQHSKHFKFRFWIIAGYVRIQIGSDYELKHIKSFNFIVIHFISHM